MDLSNSLASVTAFLTKNNTDSSRPKVFIHRPGVNTLNHYIVVINYKVNGRLIRGSAGAGSLLEAFIKALGEFGENRICMEHNIPNRSGIAGGLFFSNAITRAEAELAERDTFFYHYRNKIPFSHAKEFKWKNHNEPLMRYTLMTADLRYKTILVTDKKTAMGEAECLQFGTGTHLQEAIAITKAVQEYACIRFNHVNNPDWCRGLSERKNKTLVDSHHIASKDPRNIRRFKDLCSPQQINKPPKNTRDEIKKHLWTSEGLDSPVKMFKYVRVKHPDLIGIDFGVPEQNLCDEEKGTPLYHPFW